jgi:hypothetical protein
MADTIAILGAGPLALASLRGVLARGLQARLIHRKGDFKALRLKAEAAERIAADIAAGKITNSIQYGKMAIEYQDAIERDAFAKMIELNQKYVRESGKDGWTAEQMRLIVELQNRKAAGYRKLLK